MSDGIRIDRKGISSVLRHAARDAVDELAREVAEQVQIPDHYGIPDDAVTVDPYRTDRAAAGVNINHPAGVRAQITDGALTRAAAAVGLQVTAKR